jgi:hypothetical protein
LDLLLLLKLSLKVPELSVLLLSPGPVYSLGFGHFFNFLLDSDSFHAALCFIDADNTLASCVLDSHLSGNLGDALVHEDRSLDYFKPFVVVYLLVAAGSDLLAVGGKGHGSV